MYVYMCIYTHTHLYHDSVTLGYCLPQEVEET